MTLTRRSFLYTSLSAAAALPLVGCAGETSETNMNNETADRPQPIGKPGVQLYTVRDQMEKDVAATLAAAAAIGYQEIEFAGYFGHSAAEIRSMLDANGLASPAAHLSIGTLTEAFDSSLEDVAAVGHRYIVVPYIAEEDRQSIDDYKALCGKLNQWAEAAQAAGVRLAYHNHAFEFEELDGQIPYDVMLAECDPELVDMELDLYWIRLGGKDPFAYFEAHPGRFHLCHVKDMAADGSMAPVGTGEIDFAAIFASAEQAGLRHFFVEHDNPSDSMASIETSFGGIQRALGNEAT